MTYDDLTTEQRNAAAYIVAGHENRTEALRRAAKAWRSWAKLYEEKGEAALDELRSHIDKKIKELQAAQGNTTGIMHAREQIVMNGGPTDSLIYQLKSATHDHGVVTRSLALQRQRLNLLYGLINRIEMHGDAEPPDWLAMFDEGAVEPARRLYRPAPGKRIEWLGKASELAAVVRALPLDGISLTSHSDRIGLTRKVVDYNNWGSSRRGNGVYGSLQQLNSQRAPTLPDNEIQAAVNEIMKRLAALS